MMKEEQDKLNAIILQIGYCSLYLNHLEFLVGELIRSLNNHLGLEFDDKKFGELQFASKLKCLKKVIRISNLESDIINQVIKHNKKVDRLRIKRNKYIHGIIHTVEDNELNWDGYFITSLKQIGSFEPVSINELESLAIEFHKTIIGQQEINKLVRSNMYILRLPDEPFNL